MNLCAVEFFFGSTFNVATKSALILFLIIYRSLSIEHNSHKQKVEGNASRSVGCINHFHKMHFTRHGKSCEIFVPQSLAIAYLLVCLRAKNADEC